MVKRMLIDANHPEETRAVVLDDRYLVDFDFETSTKLQLKGNIYLAKVTRVEPSLQAAFVEYGGNRHGFLAFSEIHPDYYQVPQADRALLEDVERETATKSSSAEGEGEGAHANGDVPPAETITTDADEETAEVMADQARRRARLLRSYKIQEVVKRRQIMLVQVVKEERGNKGAALTTYLSLAGRYCVLMPNTPRGGGISRKIVQQEDRRKLKEIAQELEVPTGMGLIIRTAGQERSKAEIKRDYEYLLRLWNEIRDTTLKSVAPKMIYEEGDLIKRAMRDLYTRDIEEVLVEGEDGYRSAKRLMSMLMPSRARLVKQYREEVPLFFAYKVEDQLDGMHSPTVQLPSGGSIVIHTTEALTAIDVNSGRSTRERHIDETAVKTNLEAADEVARQLRLRDLAGLIVIDFIDMSEGRHQRAVEKRLREALKADRARIQMGRISQFGLMELSRQRLRASLQELSSQICPHCAGLGVVRSTESCALQTLRAIQELGIRGDAAALTLTAPPEVALYLLNQKRDALGRLEQAYAMRVTVLIDGSLVPPATRLEVTERRDRERERERAEAARADRVEVAPEEPDEEVAVEEPRRQRQPAQAAGGQQPRPQAAEEGEDGQQRRRRKRRRRRRRSGETGLGPELTATEAMEQGEIEDEESDEAPEAELVASADVEEPAPVVEAVTPGAEMVAPEAPAEIPVQPAEPESVPEVEAAPTPVVEEAVPETAAATAEPPAEEAPAKPARPKRPRKPRASAAKAKVEAEPPVAVAEASATEETPVPAPYTNGSAEPPAQSVEEHAEVPPQAAQAEPDTAPAELPVADDEERPQRQGWWSRWVR
ncbi:MAG: Rne/Rng family ribonuclease [Geminicoccaceae bacterium]